MPSARSLPKPDPACLQAVESAREAALAEAGEFGVGDHLGHVVEGDRILTHLFACPHPAYQGWRWSVTVVRASRARVVTVNEVVLLPGDTALVPPRWVPYAERTRADDLAPGMLAPRPDDDPRLVPGYTRSDEVDLAERTQVRGVVAELGLGRERILSPQGRDEAAVRWLAGDGGPDSPMAKQAPGRCASCGFRLGLNGALGAVFGVCANAQSPSDGSIVALDHGCGAHSDVVVAGPRPVPLPVWDTIEVDPGLFD